MAIVEIISAAVQATPAISTAGKEPPAAVALPTTQTLALELPPVATIFTREMMAMFIATTGKAEIGLKIAATVGNQPRSLSQACKRNSRLARSDNNVHRISVARQAVLCAVAEDVGGRRVVKLEYGSGELQVRFGD